jgi:hypothetical protein
MRMHSGLGAVGRERCLVLYKVVSVRPICEGGRRDSEPPGSWRHKSIGFIPTPVFPASFVVVFSGSCEPPSKGVREKVL